MYCASHQELRELAYRGVDGPGIWIGDVLPESFDHSPGFGTRYGARQSQLQTLLASRQKPGTAPAQLEMTRAS